MVYGPLAMKPRVVLEVLSGGAWASIQDLGRRGLRRAGVPWSGVLDVRLMRVANALAGNAENTPVIECFDGGQQFRARGGRLRVALAGDAVLEIEHAGERRTVPAWRSLTLNDDEVLRLRAMRGGRIAMLAVAGIELPCTLGSASTYVRAALGGIGGAALASGMELAAVLASGGERVLPQPPTAVQAPIRAVAGPQREHFSAAALDLLWSAEFRVGAEADRMGIRLHGPQLPHCGAAEIVSDATVPGSIQVPGNGQPIVLLADAQTAGGYPKIATVISADLGRLAAAPPGSVVRFAPVDALAGEALARAAEAETRALIASIRSLPAEGVDLAALYAHNLVDGVVDARAPQSPSPAEGRGRAQT